MLIQEEMMPVLEETTPVLEETMLVEGMTPGAVMTQEQPATATETATATWGEMMEVEVMMVAAVTTVAIGSRLN